MCKKGFWCRVKRFFKNCKLGQVKQVENKNPKFAANLFYYAVEVCKDGEHINLLLTENELKLAAERAIKNCEDVPGCHGCKPQ